MRGASLEPHSHFVPVLVTSESGHENHVSSSSQGRSQEIMLAQLWCCRMVLVIRVSGIGFACGCHCQPSERCDAIIGAVTSRCLPVVCLPTTLGKVMYESARAAAQWPLRCAAEGGRGAGPLAGRIGERPSEHRLARKRDDSQSFRLGCSFGRSLRGAAAAK